MALRGLKVIELAGLAPAPFCGSILADFGAHVTRVDKHVAGIDLDPMSHGKRSLALNLKHTDGAKILRDLSKQSDVLIEPFRRGVMEKLGLGPETLMKDNPRLIYARLTGYGQDGEMADRAGHDINYVSMSGLLSTLGRADDVPTPPINLLADFAGGGLTCALGIILALLERSTSGLGQIVDSSMVEGAAYVGSWIFRGQQLPIWGQPRGRNLLDSGSHVYDTYKTKDGGYVAIGPLEMQFYAQLLQGLGLNNEEAPQLPSTPEEASRVRELFTQKFASKTRDEWNAIFGKTDACVTPVLSMMEAANHPHNKHRGLFVTGKDGTLAPQAAPKLSRTPGCSMVAEHTRPAVGQHTLEILSQLGYTKDKIKQLNQDGVVSIADEKSKL